MRRNHLEIYTTNDLIAHAIYGDTKKLGCTVLKQTMVADILCVRVCGTCVCQKGSVFWVLLATANNTTMMYASYNTGEKDDDRGLVI